MSDLDKDLQEIMGNANTYTAPSNLSDSVLDKLSDDVTKQHEEDTELEYEREVSAKASEANKSYGAGFESGLPDYETLSKRLKTQGDLYEIENTSNIVVVRDWDLSLIPEDLLPRFKQYLSNKYAQYGLTEIMGNNMVVAIYTDNRTINFLNGFVNELRIPTMVSRQEGREVIVKSQFVMLPGEKVLVTERQLKSLEALEKVKREFDTDASKEPTYSDWLGFLIFRKIENPERLSEYKRSFVTYDDILKTHVDIDVKLLNTRNDRREPGVIRADK